jgi:hypothetical protein
MIEKSLKAHDAAAHQVPEQQSNGVLNQHGHDEPSHIVPQCVEKSFLIRKGEQQPFEIVKTDKTCSNQLIPRKQAVEKRHEQGQKYEHSHYG